MGPFPHDAPPATISADNPAGTDGFEFVEFAHPEPGKLEALFVRMGYVEVARHKTRDISLYRQGDINYVVNREPGTHAARFVAQHGPCAPAMAWRVVDARHALKRAVDLGATECKGADKTLDVPAVIGIGGSLLYFVDVYGAKGSAYDRTYQWLASAIRSRRGSASTISIT
jgi:4-hydroxyphenylpyruvate dioxygenase